MKQQRLNWIMQSHAYQKASNMVGEIIRSPERLSQLVNSAQSKAFDNSSRKLAAVSSSISAAARLLKAYGSGQYRSISFESLTLIVTSLVYFVMPIDVIPDFIVGLGLIDDAALITWTFKAVANDIEKFIAWERTKDSDSDLN